MKTLLLAAVLASTSTSFAAVSRRPVWKPAKESVIAMLVMAPEQRSAAFAEQPDSIYDSLWDVANDDGQPMNLRWRALTSAAMVRREKSTPDLVKAAKSREWFIRNAALVSLSEFSPARSVEVARRLVKDPALVVRSAAVDVLAKHGAAPERGLLWGELSADYNRRGQQSLWIRGQIAKALAEKPRADEQGKFSGLLAESDEGLQKAGIRGLENLTGLKLGQGVSQHEKVVKMWKNYFNRPASTLR